MATTPKCTIPNCDRGVRRKKLGLCDPHVEDRRAESGEHCIVEGCERGHLNNGYCRGHYTQKQRGQELTPLGARREPGQADHGTSTRYRHGCRCPECKEASRLSMRDYLDRYEAEHGVPYWTAKGKQGRTRTTYDRVCEYCGGAYQTHTSIARYCSSTCGVRDKAGWSKSREVILWTRPHTQKTTAAPLNILPNTWTYTTGNCSICGEAFVSKHMDVTCSNECQKEHERERKHRAAHRRRARKKNAFVSNVSRKKTFERDGYRCHICKAKTNPKGKAPNPRAPTLDHIIPLNLGGTHEPSNVATACFMCNCIKSDRGTGDQLLLFG